MPSIIMQWDGQCPDLLKRQALVRRLGELAEMAFEKFGERFERYDREITGQIVLHSSVFGERRIPPALRRDESHADWHCLENARLFGVDFRLPTIYRGDNRVTFVFLCADDAPDLDGFLVQPFTHEQRGLFRDAPTQTADWVLIAPSIHLRYAFEQWTSLLLAWVRVHYMPDLSYAEFDHLDGDAHFGYGSDEACHDLYFRRLKELRP